MKTLEISQRLYEEAYKLSFKDIILCNDSSAALLKSCDRSLYNKLATEKRIEADNKLYADGFYLLD